MARDSFRSVSSQELARAAKGAHPPLVLDVRRRAAFDERPEAIPGAVPLLLDEEPLQLPDEPRERPIVAYCLCHGETSSTRVARWLLDEGYGEVAVLIGGLDAWKQEGFPVEPVSVESGRSRVSWRPLGTPARSRAKDPFLSLLAGERLDALPQRREMSVLFVDMVESTRLLADHTPEQMLALVQAFMEIVVEVGVLHCGDVHDFEGDGAMLYFAGLGEALPAAFELRERLVSQRERWPELPLPRIALDAGPVVLGVVGGRFRRSVALVGPAVPRAARILKLAPPGGIIATEIVVQGARGTSPDLVRRFERLATEEPLRGFEHETPVLYLAAPRGA